MTLVVIFHILEKSPPSNLSLFLCTNDCHENLQICPMYLFLYLYKCNPSVALLVMWLIDNLVNLRVNLVSILYTIFQFGF